MIGNFRETGVMAAGCFVGAMLAMVIAPGDIFLWVATALVLGLFSHFFFEEKSGEGAHWPFMGGSRTHAIGIRRAERRRTFGRYPRRPTDHSGTEK